MAKSKKVKVGIVGLGMVGEPMRRWFEDIKGYRRKRDLFCYDIDPTKGYSDDVNRADVIFVSVPTPSGPDGSANISMVENTIASITDGKVVVIRSTVPPGTVESFQKKYPRKRFIFNPEFLTEKMAWEDFVSPDRQIVAPTQKALADAVEILNLLPQKNFVRPWAITPYLRKSVTATEAELGKYASNLNGYLKVVFANILADVCHALGKIKPGMKVEYDNVREMLAADLRIGGGWLDVEHGNYCGVGGYCFPKDMDAFVVFLENLISDLKKKKAGPRNVKVLGEGLGVLKAVRRYNETLLKAQGLTVEDVTKHSKDIITHKRKPHRI